GQGTEGAPGLWSDKQLGEQRIPVELIAVVAKSSKGRGTDRSRGLAHTVDHGRGFIYGQYQVRYRINGDLVGNVRITTVGIPYIILVGSDQHIKALGVSTGHGQIGHSVHAIGIGSRTARSGQ